MKKPSQKEIAEMRDAALPAIIARIKRGVEERDQLRDEISKIDEKLKSKSDSSIDVGFLGTVLEGSK